MSNKEHIRPEELELYALGALPEEEAAAWKAHLAGCGECAMRLAQAHGSAALLAFGIRQEQPAGTIKTELMARIRAHQESEERFAWPLRTKDPGTAETGERTKMAADVRSPWWNWALVPAALALALVSLTLSWQNHRLTGELTKERQAAVAMVRDRAEIENLVRVLAAPDTLTVKLAATQELPRGSGMVKYNGRMGTIIYAAELPPLDAGKCYQMWLVPENGAPIKAGVLGTSGRAMGNLWTVDVPSHAAAKGFAVTIEAAGGAAQPTGPKVLVGAS